jgi:hypothetical protein
MAASASRCRDSGRDRGGAYADAARRGAPDVQVADRLHLVQNVGAALDEVVRSRSRRKEIERVQIETAEPIVVPTAPPLPPGPAQQRARAARARRVGRWEKARALHAAGMLLRTIAHQLGINRKTVRKHVRTPAPPHNRSRPPPDAAGRPVSSTGWPKRCACAANTRPEPQSLLGSPTTHALAHPNCNTQILTGRRSVSRRLQSHGQPW